MSIGRKAKHNSSLRLKQTLRLQATRDLPSSARVLEGFAGEGGMYRSCWARFAGACMDNVAHKAAWAARTRPNWTCWEGDTLKALEAGMFPEPFDVVDLDAYGEPWPFVRAWATSSRQFATVTHLFLTDGYRRQRNLAAASRALWGDDRPSSHRGRAPAHKAVEAAIRSGTLADFRRMRCYACEKPAQCYHHPSYEPDRWLDVVPFCHGCHTRHHAQENARITVTVEHYDEQARLKLAQWGAGAGLVFEEHDARSYGTMRISYWRVSCAAASLSAKTPSLDGPAP